MQNSSLELFLNFRSICGNSDIYEHILFHQLLSRRLLIIEIPNKIRVIPNNSESKRSLQIPSNFSQYRENMYVISYLEIFTTLLPIYQFLWYFLRFL